MPSDCCILAMVYQQLLTFQPPPHIRFQRTVLVCAFPGQERGAAFLSVALLRTGLESLVIGSPTLVSMDTLILLPMDSLNKVLNCTLTQVPHLEASNKACISNSPPSVDPLPQQGQKKKIKKNTRASIHIASLNMRGRGSGQDDKWNNIN